MRQGDSEGVEALKGTLYQMWAYGAFQRLPFEIFLEKGEARCSLHWAKRPFPEASLSHPHGQVRVGETVVDPLSWTRLPRALSVVQALCLGSRDTPGILDSKRGLCVCVCVCACTLCHVWLFETPWTTWTSLTGYSLFTEFFRQKY